MSSGGPGDHPLSDVAHYRLKVYGEPTDAQLRRVVALLGYQRAYDWFTASSLWSMPEPQLKEHVAQKVVELEHDAKERGWEV